MSISYGGDNIQDTDGGVLRPISSVMRNRIINGAMVIDQRNDGASVSANLSYPVDRFYIGQTTTGAWTSSRTSGAPTGFTNCLQFTKTTGNAPASGDYNYLTQVIEGYNIADLGWGTASAKTVTLSFWVYSGATGTFGGSLRNGAANRSYPFTYTISSSNTWTYCSVTISGDTTGTWATNNTGGIFLFFDLGSGSTARATAGAWSAGNYVGATGTSTYPVSTSSGSMSFTGVQLEVGSSATGFEYRQYGTELALCQRYCLVDTNEGGSYRWMAYGNAYNSTGAAVARQLPVVMRTKPSITPSSGTTFILDGISGVATTAVTDSGFSTTSIARLTVNVASGLTAGQGMALATDVSTSLRYIVYSAEL